MTDRSTKSALLGMTAAAALLALPALAQTGAAPRDGAPGNPPSTATQRAADSVTGNRTPADGTPGNPPGTALGRAADRAAEGAASANQRAGDPLNTQNRPDGTPGNPPGTALGRAVDNLGGNAADANRRAGDPLNAQDQPDGTPGNPAGTAVTRGLDRALGTNMSGAYPQNSDGTPNNPPGTAASRAADGATTGGNASGGTMAQGAGGTGQPGAVNTTPSGDQARAGTMNVPLQNQAAGTAPANPTGTAGAAPRGAAPAAVTGAAATAPAAQTDRVSRIIGSSVYNERNEAIGSVDDVILPSGNASPLAVVSVGGFLGLGAKLVAVPMSELRWSAADNRWTITGATKESLTSLPAYSYDAARRG